MIPKEIFHIKSEQEMPAQAVLLIRCGEFHLCFAVCNNNGQVLHELVYNQSGQWNTGSLDAWMSAYPLLQHPFYEIHITWDHPSASLVPSKYYRMEEARNILLQLQGPQPLSDVISEQVMAWQLYCVYAVPAELRDWMQRHFPSALFRHQYTTALKQMALSADETSLFLDFRNGAFCLMLFRQHKLLLANTWNYQSPEDVLYYLLRTCEEFELDRETVKVFISGFIDKDSSLYKELYGYFLQISFRDAGWQLAETSYPAHYFTAVNDLYPCVS